MANILKGYLTFLILVLLLVSIISFIGSNSFLGEPKNNSSNCLKLKKKYEFINCDLLDSIGEKELIDLIENFNNSKNTKNKSVYQLNETNKNNAFYSEKLDNYLNSNISKEVYINSKSSNDNKLKFEESLINMKTIEDLKLLSFKDSNIENSIEDNSMNIDDFLDKMNSIPLIQ